MVLVALLSIPRSVGRDFWGKGRIKEGIAHLVIWKSKKERWATNTHLQVLRAEDTCFEMLKNSVPVITMNFKVEREWAFV